MTTPSITEMVIAWDIAARELEKWDSTSSTYPYPDRKEEADRYVCQRTEAIEFWGKIYRALNRQLRDATKDMIVEGRERDGLPALEG